MTEAARATAVGAAAVHINVIHVEGGGDSRRMSRGGHEPNRMARKKKRCERVLSKAALRATPDKSAPTSMKRKKGGGGGKREGGGVKRDSNQGLGQIRERTEGAGRSSHLLISAQILSQQERALLPSSAAAAAMAFDIF